MQGEKAQQCCSGVYALPPQCAAVHLSSLAAPFVPATGNAALPGALARLRFHRVNQSKAISLCLAQETLTSCI